MKTITTEQKQKIFALYWGQNVRVYKDDPPSISTVKRWDMDFPDDCYLFLTPLCNITDKDVASITEIVGEWGNGNLDKEDVSEWLDEVLYNNSQTIADYVPGFQMSEVIDFLRSRGYALPAFGYSIEELMDAGVFRLKPPAGSQTSHPPDQP